MKKTNGQLFKLLFENMLNGFAHCHAEFDAAGMLVDWTYALINPAFITLTGLGDITGKKVSEIIPELRLTNPRLFLAYGRVAKGGEHERFEEYLPTLDIWFNINVFCVEVGTFTVVFENISAYKNHVRELSEANDQTLTAWVSALAWRNKETSEHTIRVTELAIELAKSIGIYGDDLINVRRGALLHDIGKIGIPDNVLLKEDKLTDEEYAEMKKHARFAYDVLYPVRYLRPALDIPYCHHEKWDGTGYPRGMKGEEIPLAARLFAIVDTYDAMVSKRIYRDAIPKEEVLTFIESKSGQNFDPSLVQSFLSLVKQS